MAKLYYDYTHPEIDTSYDVDTWTSFKKKPSWWQGLTPFLFGCNNPKEFIESQWDRIMKSKKFGTPRTVKTCPGIGLLFKHSIPIKFPSDIWLETTAEGGFEWTTPVEGLTVTEHGPEQIQGSQISKDLIALKFQWPVRWKTDVDVLANFVDPVYYNVQPYIVAPGILSNTKTQINYLNVIAFFPRKDAKYVFYQNEICAMMYFSEPVTDMIHVDHRLEDAKFLHNHMANVFKSKMKERI